MPISRTLAISSHSSIDANHLTGLNHPEQPLRTQKIEEKLIASTLFSQSILLPPRRAKDVDILRCHTREYLEDLEGAISDIKDLHRPDDGSVTLPSEKDTRICSKSLEAARYAAGAGLAGIDSLMKGVSTRVFCNVRPPGHHADQYEPQGFCLLNNAAIAARYAQSRHQIKKIAIIDWDVHHGNGTQAIFYKDPTVFYFSTHRKNFYPGTGYEEETGEGDGLGYTLNCPIDLATPELGTPREQVIKAFNEKLIPAMERFKPELVIISAGFDAHIDDPLGGFNLTDKDFEELTLIVRKIADEHAHGRILSLLEGGYNLEALASCVQAHVNALL